MLTSLLRATAFGGCVAACGLVAGSDLSMTLYPFLLRGVTLAGLASADCPRGKRERVWELLAGDWKPRDLESFVTEAELAEMPSTVDRILSGRNVGRVLVRPV